MMKSALIRKLPLYLPRLEHNEYYREYDFLRKYCKLGMLFTGACTSNHEDAFLNYKIRQEQKISDFLSLLMKTDKLDLKENSGTTSASAFSYELSLNASLLDLKRFRREYNEMKLNMSALQSAIDQLVKTVGDNIGEELLQESSSESYEEMIHDYAEFNIDPIIETGTKLGDEVKRQQPSITEAVDSIKSLNQEVSKRIEGRKLVLEKLSELQEQLRSGKKKMMQKDKNTPAAKYQLKLQERERKKRKQKIRGSKAYGAGGEWTKSKQKT